MKSPITTQQCSLFKTIFASILIVVTASFATWFIGILINFWVAPEQTALAQLIIHSLDSRGEAFPAYLANVVAIVTSCFVLFVMASILKTLLHTILQLFNPSSTKLLKQMTHEIQSLKKQLKNASS